MELKCGVIFIYLSIAAHVSGDETSEAEKRLPDRQFLEKIKNLIRDSARNASVTTKHTIFANNLGSNLRREYGNSETHHLMLVLEKARPLNRERASNVTAKRIQSLISANEIRRQSFEGATTLKPIVENTPTIISHNDKDYISEGVNLKEESHIKYLPNAIYYNTEKKCVNWLYGCNAKVKGNILKALINDGLNFDYFHLTGKDIHSYLRDMQKEDMNI